MFCKSVFQKLNSEMDSTVFLRFCAIPAMLEKVDKHIFLRPSRPELNKVNPKGSSRWYLYCYGYRPSTGIPQQNWIYSEICVFPSSSDKLGQGRQWQPKFCAFLCAWMVLHYPTYCTIATTITQTTLIHMSNRQWRVTDAVNVDVCGASSVPKGSFLTI